MSVGWLSSAAPADPAELARLEERLGGPLPPRLRRFLLTQNGGRPADNEFAVKPGVSSGVNAFLSASEIVAELDLYGDRLPPGMLPIADTEGGNRVLVDLDAGHVLYLDHELEGSSAALVPLAEDLDEFRDSLVPFDLSSVELKPGQVKRVWVHPDLLK